LRLVQYLSHSPELPLLDPPLFCRPALELAQYVLHTSELSVGVLTGSVGVLTGRAYYVTRAYAFKRSFASPHPFSRLR
jgi:hypothetical protein